MNSIRISDHKGKEHLSYKYNVQSGIKVAKWYKDDKGFWRYSCPITEETRNEIIKKWKEMNRKDK